MELLDFEIDEK